MLLLWRILPSTSELEGCVLGMAVYRLVGGLPALFTSDNSSLGCPPAFPSVDIWLAHWCHDWACLSYGYTSGVQVVPPRRLIPDIDISN